MTFKTVFVVHLAATLFMTGLIWFVQVVHYRLFDHVGAASFAAYEEAHARLTTWVVGPPMLLELGSAVVLLRLRPVEIGAREVWLGLFLLGVIWLSTALIQVPQHNALGAGFDFKTYRALVGFNWIRTIAWSLRSLLVLSSTLRLLR